jgi:mono/diheme cytochrome c family protein
MLGHRKQSARSLTVIFACAGVIVMGQTRTAQYTAKQAAAGRSAYEAYCASCHLPDLGGRNEAPQLAGTNFMQTWGARSTNDLLKYMQGTMPPGSSGSLGPETYADLVAFIWSPSFSKPMARAPESSP